MEGNATIGQQDRTVDPRFQVLWATDCSNLGRLKGHWYAAVPPLCRCWSGLTPADYFGRTLVANLPSNIRVGVVNVSVAGCAIELYDKVNYPAYVSTAPSWMISIINAYGGNPYAYLVEIAKLAQKDGVIKGILMHQGESNVGDNAWPSKVKSIYNNLIQDLSLKADSIPLLAGEVVNADQGGACASMNSIIAKLPQTIPNSYVISSSGCTDTTDNLHFNAAGYRELGRRYGVKMLSLLGTPGTSTVEENLKGTIDGYALDQNYPNPFNPTTVIHYQLLKAGNVRLTIYNLLGQNIRTLQDTFQNAGEYSIVWDARDNRNGLVSSGMYYYRLEAGDNIFQKKMILMK
jgi:hypothetical protein